MASKSSRQKGGGKNTASRAGSRPANTPAPSASPAGSTPFVSAAAPAPASGASGPSPAPAGDLRSDLPGGSSELPPLRGWPLGVLLLALLAGLSAAAHLTHLHLQLFYGSGTFTSRCDFGGGFNCSEVNGSAYSELFGFLPLSLMAIPAYAVMLMLTLLGRSLQDRRALGLVTLLGLVSTLFSAYLFYVSKFLIGSVCLFCMAMYVVNILALVMPMVAARAGLSDMLRAAFRGLGQRRLVMLSAFNLLLVGSLAWGAYTGLKGQMVQETAQKALQQANQPRPAATASAASTASAGKPVKRGFDEKVEVPVDPSVPFRGDPNAKVTLVAYEDFQCGFCKRLSGNLESLVEKYPKDVKVGFRHFPMNTDCNGAQIAKSMHPDACRASIAAECARQQNQFWPYHDQLFKNQGNLKSHDLQAYAEQVGLNMEEFNACQKDPATVEKIRQDSVTGGNLGVTGTPTFFINGRQFSGAQPVEVMSAVVDAELKGQSITLADLRDVPKPPDITGKVTTPEMVKLKGPYGEFEIDAVEASIQGGKAMAKAGTVATTNVTWFDADKACRASGKRLCTEAEWLTACSGVIPEDRNSDGSFTDDYATGTAYPYGDHYKAGICNDQVELPKGADPNDPPPPPPLLTGNHPECRSKFNVFDLTGNVREWVGTVPSKSAFMGGGFYSRDDAACGSRNESVGPAYKHEATGFRCCKGGNPPEAVTHPGREVGEKLKPFTAQTLEGKKFDSSSLKGKVTLLTFWASWCGPCRKELPAYSAMYPELEKKGFQIIAVNVDQELDKARRFLDQYPVSFPVVTDPDSSLFHSFDVRGNGTLPTAFLIDKNGVIVQRKSGFDDGDDKRLKNTVEKMLGG
jgi:protein-disulfide isomerase/uncharacterized membrane protein/peroxiredoxin